MLNKHTVDKKREWQYYILSLYHDLNILREKEKLQKAYK